jgi:hypothetical protein
MEMMQMLDPGRSPSETERRALLMEAGERSILYLADINARPVACSAEALERLATLREPLPVDRHSLEVVELATIDYLTKSASCTIASKSFSSALVLRSGSPHR